MQHTGKYWTFLLLALTSTAGLQSQVLPAQHSKQVVNTDVTFHWSWLREGCTISPDGRYAAWVVGKIGSDTLTIAATDGSRQQQFPVKASGSFPGFFTSDSRQYIFPMPDKWCLLELQRNKKRYIEKTSRVLQQNGKWLVWQRADSTAVTIENLLTGHVQRLPVLNNFTFDRTGQWLMGRAGKQNDSLLLYRPDNGKQHTFPAVKGYQLKEDGLALLVQQSTSKGTQLQYISLADGKQWQVCATDGETELQGYCINNAGDYAGYTIKDKKNPQDPVSHWCYQVGDTGARRLVPDPVPGLSQQLTAGAGLRFTPDGRHLLFPLTPAVTTAPKKASAVQVEVWSYRDKLLYSSQPQDPIQDLRIYTAVAPVTSGKIQVLVTTKYESSIKAIAGDYALIVKDQTGDRFWEYKRDSIWLAPLQGGEWRLLPFEKTGFLEMDKAGTAVTCFDQLRGRHFYKYDIATRQEQKLSAGVPDWTLGVENRHNTGWSETQKLVNLVVAARLAGGDQLLTYDNFDLWQIDLTGKKQAKNLTNGYGSKHQLVFRLTVPKESVITHSDALLLTAFSENSKANGFYRTAKADPDSLYMGPFFFSHSRDILGNLMPEPYSTGLLPIKAAAANAWIVQRETATEAPNYFFTKDFNSFQPLTHLQPQQSYNWYTTELVHFTQADGQPNQGVLFKPADFDPHKKYPVLYYCYEQYSMLLNRFIPAQVSEAGKPNIPWYVSRGYLVFTPDHYFKRGYRNKSTLVAAEGAVRELIKRPYVDEKKIGIMGVSRGGGFTNYIITHSKLFAAAFEGCGVSNTVSAALQLGDVGYKGGSRLLASEASYGSNMWDAPKEWVYESPVVQAHTVTTPLLIMHNKKDGAVLFEQAIELFTALRRLNKKAWLLQYDEGSHGVIGKEAQDLTIRMTQFFDHYLKGTAPARWMTQGIPSGLKGIDDGLQLDSMNIQP